MSQILISRYLTELANLKKVSGTNRESVVREAFKDLLKSWGRSQDLVFIPEYEIESKTKQRRYVDGALLHTLRVPFGYWEAKDSDDDLDAEIAIKFKAGYPKSNILFEDSNKAVLIQHGQEVMRCGVGEVAQLEKLLQLFFGYERPEIEAFRKAVEQFKTDLPAVLESLRGMIEKAYSNLPSFHHSAEEFLAHAKEAINPSLVAADVREMLIQHILTGEVFAAVFPGTNYHEDNSVARELFKLENTFFTGNTKHQTLKGLEAYYAAIRKAASDIGTHHEKQTFLKSIYENFYKVYNPKAADRLGVVYTPNEIVRFMIQGADWLCQQHFKKNLIDQEVDILDPATGTGTFICELIENFSGQPAKLKHKYMKELHANEVAVLPYYVANLNIEATFAAATGAYEEFPGLCFVDTLDNTYALRKHAGHIDDIFGGVSDDNVKRIKQQNSRRISVIIGNPPYNANQLSENENNKNREYPEIDKRIKETYVEKSNAQKTKVYDMYARFFRWASDRLDENGILAFVTNRSFIESRTFDGFRSVVAKEFHEIRIVDLGGDVRANPRLSGTTHNVFGIQTGVAISFFIKKAKTKGCRIYYVRRPEMETAEEKLAFLADADLQHQAWAESSPDEMHNWLHVDAGEFESFLPLISKDTKFANSPRGERAIFKLFSMGAITARDSWVFGFSDSEVIPKAKYLVDAYNNDRERLAKVANKANLAEQLDYSIKWTRSAKKDLLRNVERQYDAGHLINSLYRPFVRKRLYFAPGFIEMPNQMPAFFPRDTCNRVIFFNDRGSRSAFSPLASSDLAEYHLAASTDGFQGVGEFVYGSDGSRVDNITDWALGQFKRQYKPNRGRQSCPITKEAIFHYVYAVLHDPLYREKYAQKLKREFPRIPFYQDFWQWSEWGKALMDLHVGYAKVTPYSLKRVDVPDERARHASQQPKVLLRASKNLGALVLDSETTLFGVPAMAWDYSLGNRSALEWVLDQYKESTPRDSTIRDKFNTYRFADHKERVAELLAQVTTVSLETMAIVEQMRKTEH
jgi:predicted helicase